MSPVALSVAAIVVIGLLLRLSLLVRSACLLCAIRLAWPRVGQRDGRWAFACGLAGGLALWMHPLAVWYVGAAILTLLARVRWQRLLAIMSLGLPGFAVGGLPIWIFNVQTGGATAHFVLSGSQGQTGDRGAVFDAWWNNDLPRGAGLWHPWGPNVPFAGAGMAALLVLAVVWAVFGRRCLRL